MLGIIMIILGIWVLKVISSRPQKYPCYVGEIVDIGMRPRSHTKHVAKCPIIVRVIINNQPIVTSTLSTVNCVGGVILIVVGIISMLVEILMTVVFLWGYV